MVKKARRPTIFKWRQTEPGVILCAVRWYLRYSLSLRDVEELLTERGLTADHTPIWRWVQCYGPELEWRMRRHLKPTNKSWRVDETYVRVHGRWCYLYRAIDSSGATIDFLLSAVRDADAAKRLFRKALSDPAHPQPHVINTDRAPLYGAAIPDLKQEATLRRRCWHRPVQYLNNILEQDHRAIKRRVNAKQGFREFQAACRTLQGYEAINMLRKGQVRWLNGNAVRRQIQFMGKLFELPPEMALSMLLLSNSAQPIGSCNTTD
jgi:transposase-like protein